MHNLNDGHALGPDLFTETEIAQQVQSMADCINRDYRHRHPVLVVGILKGAGFFTADLVRSLNFPVALSYATVSSYGVNTVQTGGPRLTQDLDIDPRGYHVIVVEDVIDTGHTLNFMQRHLLGLGALTVESAVLLDLQKNTAARGHLPRYVGFKSSANWVCGYGIDYKEKYRNFRNIVEVQQPG